MEIVLTATDEATGSLVKKAYVDGWYDGRNNPYDGRRA
jgi:hypothetical protein